MKQRILWTCMGIVLAFCLSGCTKYRLDRKETKLLGSWVFDDVRKGPWTGRQDVTHRWDMYIVTFGENGAITWYNKENGEELEGVWALSEVNQDRRMVTLLSISLRDSSNSMYVYTWEVNRLTKELLKVHESAAKARDQMLYFLRRQ